MRGASSKLLPLSILLSFFGVALLQSWPLPLHLRTHFTGAPQGDAGVYIWNQWVFRHELANGRSPLATDTVLPLEGRLDLSLHNYTVFADLLAAPLLPHLGTVATFNVVYLINVALAGWGMFLLARRVTGRTAESWLAGLLFACSPFLVARATSHFSLAAAAPLPFFLYWFDRAFESRRARDAAAAGACVAWAAYSDPYYAIYCAMCAVVVLVCRLFSLALASHPTPTATSKVLDGVGLILACAILGIHVLARGTFAVGPLTLTMRTLYTPMFILTLVVVASVVVRYRPRLVWQRVRDAPGLSGAVLVAAASAAVLMAPELQAMVARATEGRFVSPPVLWRSSAPGVDLVALFAPNPNHPLAPRAVVAWLASEPGLLAENVVAIPFVALAVVVAARIFTSFRLAPLWVGITVGFGLLTLGPFVRVAGFNTAIPTPWTFLRYVPLVGEARMPPRFGILMMLGMAVLFAGALAALGDRLPAKRRRVLLVVAGLLAFELWPVPRELHSAAVPPIYQRVAADPRPVRLLELPLGFRDGLSSTGAFSAVSLYRQTFHQKGILGGYLSRISPQTKDAHMAVPMFRALVALSEGGELDPTEEAEARANAADFIRIAGIGYVLIDVGLMSPHLRAFAIDSLRLTLVERDGPFELYAPGK